MSSPSEGQQNPEPNDADREVPGELLRLAVVSSPPDREAGVAVLKDELGWTEIDAKTRLRHVPAIWPEQLSAESAHIVSERLKALGAELAAVPKSRLPDLLPGSTLHHVQCRDDGFAIVSLTGQIEHLLTWANLKMMSIASVAGLRESADNPLPDGVFRHAPGIAHFDDHPEHSRLEMWLVADNPVRGFHIEAELMNYEYLEERLSPSSEANFSALVADIRQNAEHLVLTPLAQAFVDKLPAQKYRLASPIAHRDATAAFWAVRGGG